MSLTDDTSVKVPGYDGQFIGPGDDIIRFCGLWQSWCLRRRARRVDPVAKTIEVENRSGYVEAVFPAADCRLDEGDT